jgi:D-cysteine desulfhydrase
VIPLFARYPRLTAVPRVSLGEFPTPVVPLVSISPKLWIKRDDLCADPLGGNKARALEFLLGNVRAGDSLVTVGAVGSTHALAVATYGQRLGARVLVGRWKQEMNAVAGRVAALLTDIVDDAPTFRTPVGAFLWAARQRWRGAEWIAAGGSTPLGILGHVNAGLELAAQIDAGVIPCPQFVVVPLGTGGTTAGLALAFAIARQPITVVGARVVPRIVARRSRILRLANATASLIERSSGEKVPRVSPEAIQIVHDTYGGAYGRETEAGRSAARALRDAEGLALDATYSAKAFGRALELSAHARTLFWLTFDSRPLTEP